MPNILLALIFRHQFTQLFHLSMLSPLILIELIESYEITFDKRVRKWLVHQL